MSQGHNFHHLSELLRDTMDYLWFCLVLSLTCWQYFIRTVHKGETIHVNVTNGKNRGYSFISNDNNKGNGPHEMDTKTPIIRQCMIPKINYPGPIKQLTFSLKENKCIRHRKAEQEHYNLTV